MSSKAEIVKREYNGFAFFGIIFAIGFILILPFIPVAILFIMEKKIMEEISLHPLTTNMTILAYGIIVMILIHIITKKLFHIR